VLRLFQLPPVPPSLPIVSPISPPSPLSRPERIQGQPVPCPSSPSSPSSPPVPLYLYLCFPAGFPLGCCAWLCRDAVDVGPRSTAPFTLSGGESLRPRERRPACHHPPRPPPSTSAFHRPRFLYCLSLSRLPLQAEAVHPTQHRAVNASGQGCCIICICICIPQPIVGPATTILPIPPPPTQFLPRPPTSLCALAPPSRPQPAPSPCPTTPVASRCRCRRSA